jgi:hypothetical protein
MRPAEACVTAVKEVGCLLPSHIQAVEYGTSGELGTEAQAGWEVVFDGLMDCNACLSVLSKQLQRSRRRVS